MMHRATISQRPRSTRLASLLPLALVTGVVAPFPIVGTALALPLIEAVIVERDFDSATVEIFLTTPDAGLVGYAFSVAYTGSLTLDQGQCFAALGSSGCNAGTRDRPGESPPLYGSLFGLAMPGPGPDFFPPFGAGGERSLVGRLTFSLNGAGGSVEPGFFRPDLDGVADANWDFTTHADFSGANLGLFSLSGVTVVPEPATGLMVAGGLLCLGYPRRRTRASPERTVKCS